MMRHFTLPRGKLNNYTRLQKSKKDQKWNKPRSPSLQFAKLFIPSISRETKGEAFLMKGSAKWRRRPRNWCGFFTLLSNGELKERWETIQGKDQSHGFKWILWTPIWDWEGGKMAWMSDKWEDYGFCCSFFVSFFNSMKINSKYNCWA